MKATELLSGLQEEIASKMAMCFLAGVEFNNEMLGQIFEKAMEYRKYDLVVTIPDTITDQFPDFEIERCNPACPLFSNDYSLCIFELTNGGCHSPGKNCPRYTGHKAEYF